jgi:response regulator of citrate/malate metabolism
MSPTEDLDTVYQCLKSGADHYIIKPLKEDHLRNLFQSVYRKKQESEAIAKLNNEMTKSTR